MPTHKRQLAPGDVQANGKQPLAEVMRTVVSGKWLAARNVSQVSGAGDSNYGARRAGFEMADSRFKRGGVPMRSGYIPLPLRWLSVIRELTPFSQRLIVGRVAAIERGTR